MVMIFQHSFRKYHGIKNLYIEMSHSCEKIFFASFLYFFFCAFFKCINIYEKRGKECAIGWYILFTVSIILNFLHIHYLMDVNTSNIHKYFLIKSNIDFCFEIFEI